MSLTRRRQSARRMLVVREITVVDAATFIGCSRSHLVNALRGRTHPNADVRAKLPELLGLPIEALFDEELLATDYAGPRGRKAAHRG
ncbi:hypothetical protein [Curtobacterium sp. BH-2-1-1]|uniref:hypothetical protein n=1 Tax=Curtobacterium sp. BH-2-1-1 TaxID=1905847 RepID=UPI0011A9993A|nr:hypothetical protein [Curtobacterium sp. BH-2-1-1]